MNNKINKMQSLFIFQYLNKIWLYKCCDLTYGDCFYGSCFAANGLCWNDFTFGCITGAIFTKNQMFAFNWYLFDCCGNGWCRWCCRCALFRKGTNIFAIKIRNVKIKSGMHSKGDGLKSMSNHLKLIFQILLNKFHIQNYYTQQISSIRANIDTFSLIAILFSANLQIFLP